MQCMLVSAAAGQIRAGSSTHKPAYQYQSKARLIHEQFESGSVSDSVPVAQSIVKHERTATGACKQGHHRVPRSRRCRPQRQRPVFGAHLLHRNQPGHCDRKCTAYVGCACSLRPPAALPCCPAATPNAPLRHRVEHAWLSRRYRRPSMTSRWLLRVTTPTGGMWKSSSQSCSAATAWKNYQMA